MQMTCPKCHGQMRQYERSGVIVDQCGECRGIFLDRGELERLLDAESAWHGGPSSVAPPPPYQQGAGRPHREYESGDYPTYSEHGRRQGKKRRGFLEELFD
jgi:uncharacterized protein